MAEKLGILLRGVLMGLADVVPGVSGGTMALLLGIYERFINAVKSLNFRWIPGFFVWARSGFKAESRDAFTQPIADIHWGFLVPLGIGLVGAIGVGSRIIPDLMDTYPAIMRGLFMGLVVASIVVPIMMMARRGPAEIGVAALTAVTTFLLVGSSAAPPTTIVERSHEEALSLKDFTRNHPSAADPMALYCPQSGDSDNPSLRAAIAEMPEQPVDVALLDAICAEMAAAGTDVESIAAVIHHHHLDDKEANPFNNAMVPAYAPIKMPVPALWFIFAAGFVAICAMVLPGISGSFILLIFGAYYFVLSSLKGLIEGGMEGAIRTEPLLFVIVFSIGALLGLLTFSRLLSFLLREHRDLTLGALVGLMIGSLRVLWPFKVGALHGGPVKNVIPDSFSAALPALAAFVVGLIAVLALTWLGGRAGRVGDATDSV